MRRREGRRIRRVRDEVGEGVNGSDEDGRLFWERWFSSEGGSREIKESLIFTWSGQQRIGCL